MAQESNSSRELTLIDRLRFVQEAGHIGIWEWGVQAGSLMWTDEVYRLHGKVPGNFIPSYESWMEIIHPEDREYVTEEIRRSQASGGAYDVRFRVIWGDGSIHWIITRGGVEKDAAGNTVRMVGITFDMTDRMRAEEALQEKERELRVITDAMPAQIAYIDRDLRYGFTNNYYEHVFGVHPDTLRGMKLVDVLGDQFEKVRPYMERALRGEQVYYEITLQHPVRRTPWHNQVRYIPDIRNGEVRGFFVLVNDVTRLRQAEEGLRRSEKLATAGRLAATIAHEINNPLEAITNLVFLAMNDEKTADPVKQYLKAAEQELRRVHHIVNQTLVFYRDPSAPKKLDLREKIEGLITLYQRRLQSKNLRVEAKLEEAGYIIGLPGEVRQVLANLVSNAIDASPIGGVIRISIRPHRMVGERGEGVRILVADQGSGIEPKLRERIFEPFFTTKAEIGTGLGLWVAKGIIEKHGGVIRVHSKPASHRTIFTLVLPRDSAAAHTKGAKAPS